MGICVYKLPWRRPRASRCRCSAPSFAFCSQHGDPFNIFETVFGGGGGGQRMHFQFQQGGGMGGGEAHCGDREELLYMSLWCTSAVPPAGHSCCQALMGHAPSACLSCCVCCQQWRHGCVSLSGFPSASWLYQAMLCAPQAWAAWGAGGSSARRQASMTMMHSYRCGDAVLPLSQPQAVGPKPLLVWHSVAAAATAAAACMATRHVPASLQLGCPSVLSLCRT